MSQRRRHAVLSAASGLLIVALPAATAAADHSGEAADSRHSGAARAVPAGPGTYVPQRIIGGPSSPALSAWGIVHNPVTNEILVGDYLTSQVRRMTRDGRYLGDLQNPGSRIGGVASALGVDPRDGSIYLAVTGEGRTSDDVRKYDKFGNYLFGLDMPTSTTWLTVDKDGYLWVPSAYKGARLTRYRVDNATKSATAVLTISKPGTGPGQFGSLTGIGTDNADHVYVADVGNKVVHAYTPTGAWRFDLGKGLFPGDIRGVTVDNSTGNIYVANSAIGTIEVFSKTGTRIKTFGGIGTGNGQFIDGARQLTMTADGNLYAADYGGQRVQRFTAGGSFAAFFPDPPMPMDRSGIAQSRALDIDPVTGDIVMADAWGQRVLRYGPDGTLLDSHGRRGSTTPDGMNYPKGVAIDPGTRNVWVANFEGAPDLVGYTKDFGSVVRRIVTPRFINDLEWSGGLLYARERRPGALHVYNPATGGEVRTWVSTKGLIRGVGVDAATKNVWITSDTKPEVYVLSPAGAIIRTVPITGLGWDVAIRGDYAYVASTTGNTVQIFDRRTYALVGTVGGTGSKFGQLNQPSGLAFNSAGSLYVVETAGSRVQQFSVAAPPPAEAVKPTTTIAATVVGGQLTVTGRASDGSGIAGVGVRVRDLTTNRYFHATLGTWVTTATLNAGIVWGPITATDWRYVVPGTLPGRSYRVDAVATDRRGNASATMTTTLSVP